MSVLLFVEVCLTRDPFVPSLKLCRNLSGALRGSQGLLKSNQLRYFAMATFKFLVVTG